MRALVAASVFVVASLACGRSETPAPASAPAPPPISSPAPGALPGRGASIELGTAVDAQGRVTAPAAVFAAGDTIHASVVTEGQPPGATLTARWTYEDGQVVSEGRETLATSDEAVTEFHVAKPDGWPAGRYQVEIALNGRPLGTRGFEVR